MKKTMKVMALLLFAITMATVLGSCSKEDGYQSKIKGKWQVTHFYGHYERIGGDYDWTWDNSYKNGKFWIFNPAAPVDSDDYDLEIRTNGSDGTDDELEFLETTIMGVGKQILCTISDDTLVIKYPLGAAESAKIIELTNTTLILRFDCIENSSLGKYNYEATIEFKKV